MSKLYDDLVTGLSEAIEFEKGEGAARATSYVITPVKRYSNTDVKRVRRKVGMTQAVFADYMGVSKKTVEAWENGRTHPAGSACRLLDILASERFFDLPFIRMKEA